MNIVDPDAWFNGFRETGKLPERLVIKHTRAKKILSLLPETIPVVCEVGVFAGELSEMLMLMRSDLHMILVDSWGDLSPRYIRSEPDAPRRNFAAAQEACHRRMSKFGGRAFMVKQTSTEAAKLFSNQSFDLIYLDGDHTYEGVKEDLAAWVPKVKVGGYMSGHDYWGPEAFGVAKAVNERFKQGVVLDEPTCSWYYRATTQ